MSATRNQACIYVPARWRGPEDVLHWRSATGEAAAGTLAEMPALDRPCLVLGWPAVSIVRAAVPPGLHQHPQALAAALEDHLLQPPEEVFALALDKDREPARCALVSRAFLGGVLEALAGRGIFPGRAVPEAWGGRPGEVILTAEGGWATGRDGVPVLLDGWSTEKPPTVLACLVQRDGLQDLRLRCGPGLPSPDGSAWGAVLACRLALDDPWSWSEAVGGPDLLRFEFRPRPALGRALQPFLRPLVLGLGLLAVLDLALSAADWARLSWRERHLQAELTSAYRAAFPGQTPLLAPVLQAQRALGPLRRAAGEWGDDDFVPLATRALPLLALLPAGSLKALALEEGGLVLEAEGLKALAPRLARAAAQAGLSARLKSDGRLLIAPGGGS